MSGSPSIATERQTSRHYAVACPVEECDQSFELLEKARALIVPAETDAFGMTFPYSDVRSIWWSDIRYRSLDRSSFFAAETIAARS
jgi:hypothetical protein